MKLSTKEFENKIDSMKQLKTGGNGQSNRDHNRSMQKHWKNDIR